MSVIGLMKIHLQKVYIFLQDRTGFLLVTYGKTFGNRDMAFSA